VDKILPKLDVYAAPGPSGLWNSHLSIWTRVFAPESADEAVEHLETLINDMANDKPPTWFMQELVTTNHKSVQIPNTISKVGDKATLEQFQADYIREMMPH
jgi:hypothetical protein